MSAETALALLHPDGHVADPHRDVVVAVRDDLLRRELPEDAIVAAPPRARAARAALERRGFRPVLRLAHAPDGERSRFVFPVRDPAVAFALEVIPLRPSKRSAARLLARVGAFPSTTDVFRKPRTRPLLGWLAALGERRERCSALITQSWRNDGEAVVFRFATTSVPDLVVKVGPSAAVEAASLRDVAPSARAAGARVPEIVTTGRLGAAPMVAQSFVRGGSAFERVKGSVARADGVLRVLARWLERWNSATASTRAFDERDVALLVEAAATLGDRFVEETRRLAARVVGTPIPFVAAHNDLTAVNVLVGGDGEVGVVDWSSASSTCLPLGDLAYAAADLAAAVDGYRDRLASFERGSLDGLGTELVGRAARSLRLESSVVDLCLHACWLQHAANERETGPFREILRRSMPH